MRDIFGKKWNRTAIKSNGAAQRVRKRGRYLCKVIPEKWLELEDEQCERADDAQERF